MSDHKTLCHCCGKMMVPKVIFSRGSYGGYGWRIGGGKPISNCCPFCLSESWHGIVMPSSSLSEKLFILLGFGLGIIASLLAGLFLIKLIDIAGLTVFFPWFHILAIGLAVWMGYSFYFWFIDYDFKSKE